MNTRVVISISLKFNMVLTFKNWMKHVKVKYSWIHFKENTIEIVLTGTEKERQEAEGKICSFLINKGMKKMKTFTEHPKQQTEFSN